MPRLSGTKKNKSACATELSRLKEELQRVTEQLESRGREQAASSDILGIIASLPSDLQPVLNTVVENAARLCGAHDAQIGLAEGQFFRMVTGLDPLTTGRTIPITPNRVSGRAFVKIETVHVADLAARVESEFSDAKNDQEKFGTRTILAMPLIRKGRPIGVIVLRRTEVQLFTDKQVALLKTFADQAVIAIENVRLFQELQTRTGELAQSIEELKALGEVSRIVSSTLDLETVLTSIVSNAVHLSGTDGGAVYEFDEKGQEFHLRATYRLDERLMEALRANPPRLGDGAMGLASMSHEPIEITDILDADAYDWPLRDLQVNSGVRAVLAIPLLREDRIIGGLVVQRKSPGAFRPQVIDLLKTFATQSALAIQDARLFRNIAEQRQQLEVANEQLLAIDRLKSSFLSNVSHELRTPLAAIGSLVDNMLDGVTGEMNEKQTRYVSGIKDSSERLARLINDLLDLSVIESGRVKLEPSRFSVGDLVDEVAATMGPVAQTKSVTLEAPADSGNHLAWADRDRITQVLTNLVGNAIKFTPEGGTVSVDIAPATDDEWISIRVSDTGPGIPEESASRFSMSFIRSAGLARKRSRVWAWAWQFQKNWWR